MGDPDKPFSTRWYATPAAQRQARRVGARLRHLIVAQVRNLPDATTLRILALVLLVLSSAFFVYPRTILRIETQVMHRSDLTTHAIPTVRPANPVISTGSIGVSAGSQNGPLSAAAPFSASTGTSVRRAQWREQPPAWHPIPHC